MAQAARGRPVRQFYCSVSVKGRVPLSISVAPLSFVRVTELNVAAFSLRLKPGTLEPNVTCASKVWPASAPLPGVNESSDAPEPPLVSANIWVVSLEVQAMVAEFWKPGPFGLNVVAAS